MKKGVFFICIFILIFIPIIYAQTCPSPKILENRVNSVSSLDEKGYIGSTISGNKIAWSYSSPGSNSYDVAFCDATIASGPGSCTNPKRINLISAQIWPSFYDTKLIWADYRDGNYNVYRCDVSKADNTPGACFPDSSNEKLTNFNNLIYLEIKYDRFNGQYIAMQVVYPIQGGNNYKSKLIVSDSNGGNQLRISEITGSYSSVRHLYSSIYNGKIVWEENSDIYMYDLSTNTERQITNDAAIQNLPQIYNNIIVWQDKRNGNWDIYMYDLSTNTERQITTNTIAQIFPVIYDNKIIWQDNRPELTYPNSIFGYDLTTGEEKLILLGNSSHRLIHPYIDSNKIIYRNDVYGDYDKIMLAEYCTETDADNDGYDTRYDCNDSDLLIHPNADEIDCDGIDNNCNGYVDEDSDVDKDGYTICDPLSDDYDCDDTKNYVNPGRNEICDNTVDENCDGIAPGDATGIPVDQDNDGFWSCKDPPNYNNILDCDDSNGNRYPGATEIPYNNLDEDCSDYDLADVDQDGFCLSGYAIQDSAQCLNELGNTGADCDDNNFGVNPNAQETCGDSIDYDCDGQDSNGYNLGSGCGSGNCVGTVICDGSDLNKLTTKCNSDGNDCGTCCSCNSEGIESYDSTQNTDCAATECFDSCSTIECGSSIYADYPDSLENTCASLGSCTTNSCAGTASCEPDADNDGFSPTCGDCDDATSDDPPAVCPLTLAGCNDPKYTKCAICTNPTIPELCDGIDNNCNGQIDETCIKFGKLITLSSGFLEQGDILQINIVPAANGDKGVYKYIYIEGGREMVQLELPCKYPLTEYTCSGIETETINYQIPDNFGGNYKVAVFDYNKFDYIRVPFSVGKILDYTKITEDGFVRFDGNAYAKYSTSDEMIKSGWVKNINDLGYVTFDVSSIPDVADIKEIKLTLTPKGYKPKFRLWPPSFVLPIISLFARSINIVNLNSNLEFVKVTDTTDALTLHNEIKNSNNLFGTFQTTGFLVKSIKHNKPFTITLNEDGVNDFINSLRADDKFSLGIRTDSRGRVDFARLYDSEALSQFSPKLTIIYEVPPPILHCKFNGTTTCEDGENPSAVQGVSYDLGYEDQGIFIDNDDTLVYSRVDNIDTHNGTVEFWVKGGIWNNNQRNDFFSIADGNYHIVIFKYTDNKLNFRHSANFYYPSDPISTVETQTWGDEWHHIAMTWSEGTTYLETPRGKLKAYLDGVEIGSLNQNYKRGINGDVYIGRPTSSAPGVNRANTLIDNFKIYGYARNSYQICEDANKTFTECGLEIPSTIPNLNNFVYRKGFVRNDVNLFTGNSEVDLDLISLKSRIPFNLNLRYNSEDIKDASWVGSGWDLSYGYIYRNNYITAGSDDYTLVLPTGAYKLVQDPVDTTLYRTEDYQPWKIVIVPYGSVSLTFEDGTKYIFGHPSQGNNIYYRFDVAKIIDLNGNQMIFNYENEQYNFGGISLEIPYLKLITDAANRRIEFILSDRNDIIDSNGASFKKLDLTKIYNPDNSFLQSFRFNYDYSNNGKLALRTITRGSLSKALTPTKFDYTNQINFENQKLSRLTNPIGGVNEFNYDNGGNVISKKIIDFYSGTTGVYNYNYGITNTTITMPAGYGSIIYHFAETDPKLEGKVSKVELLNNLNEIVETTDYTWNLLDNSPALGVYTTNIISRINTKGSKTTQADYTYDNYGNVLELNDLGYLSDQNDDLKMVNTFGYDTANWVVNKLLSIKFYDDLNTLVKDVNYVWDNNGINLISLEEADVSNPANKRAYNFEYNTKGDVIKSITPEGQITTPESRYLIYNYDNFGNIISLTTPFYFYTYSYYPNGLIENKMDPKGAETKYEYDDFLRPIKFAKPGDTLISPTYEIKYNDNEHPFKYNVEYKINDGKKGKFYIISDGFGRRSKIIAENEQPSDYYMSGVIYPIVFYYNTTIFDVKYDSYGNLINSYLPYDTKAEYSKYSSDIGYTKEPNSKLSSIGDLERGTISASNSLEGDSFTVVSPSGGSIITTLDSRANKLSENYEGRQIDYNYDSFGRLLGIIAPTGSVNLTYDSFDRINKKTSNMKRLNEEYIYDKDGLPIQRKTPEGNIINYEYDLQGRLIKVDYPESPLSGQDIIIEYDGNLIKRIGTSSLATEYTYDSQGRIIDEIKTINGVLYSTNFVYDKASNIISMSTPCNVTTKKYNKIGSVTELRKGNELVVYLYSKDGRLSKIKNHKIEAYRDVTGEVKRKFCLYNPCNYGDAPIDRSAEGTNIIYSKGGTVSEYISAGRQYYEKIENKYNTLETKGYTERTFQEIYRDDTGGLRTSNLLNYNKTFVDALYRYDNLSRLILAENVTPLRSYDDNGNLVINLSRYYFEYDPQTGNRVSMRRDNTFYTYDGLTAGNNKFIKTREEINNLARNYVYNSNNELISDGVNNYVYNSGGRLTQVGPHTFAYDYEGNIIEAGFNNNAEVVRYYYDPFTGEPIMKENLLENARKIYPLSFRDNCIIEEPIA